MAIIKDGYLRGQVGNVVHRKLGTQQVLQTRPGRKVKQTASTMEAAEDFGYASSAGALIRQAFVNTHQKLCDDKMHNRLIQNIHRAMRCSPHRGFNSLTEGNIQRLEGFQFNPNCHLQDYLFVDPKVTLGDSRQICIHFPSFHRLKHLYVPKDCQNIVLQIEVIGLKFWAKTLTFSSTKEIEITTYGVSDPIIPQQTLCFDPLTDSCDGILVGMSVLYIDKVGSRHILRNTRELHPAAIIAAFRVR